MFRYCILFFLVFSAEATRSKRVNIIPPSEVQGVDGLLLLGSLTSYNLKNYVGHRHDESADSCQKTLSFLARFSLIANTRQCWKCTQYMSLVKDCSANEGSKWRCPNCRNNPGEGSKISVKTNSFFASSKLSMREILYLAADWIDHPGRNIDEVTKKFEISRDTVINFHELFRQLTKQWFFRLARSNPADIQLGGKDAVVEIDETLMYKAKYNRGTMLTREQVWVFGMTERGTSKVVMFQVKDRSAATLLPIIRKYVKPESMIVSDGWRAYGGIRRLQAGYDHQWVNHKVNFVDPNDRRVHTQSIEATWGSLKRKLKGSFGIKADRLEGHMFNYMFRRYYNNDKLLNHLIQEMKFMERNEVNEDDMENDLIPSDPEEDESDSSDNLTFSNPSSQPASENGDQEYSDESEVRSESPDDYDSYHDGDDSNHDGDDSNHDGDDSDRNSSHQSSPRSPPHVSSDSSIEQYDEEEEVEVRTTRKPHRFSTIRLPRLPRFPPTNPSPPSPPRPSPPPPKAGRMDKNRKAAPRKDKNNAGEVTTTQSTPVQSPKIRKGRKRPTTSPSIATTPTPLTTTADQRPTAKPNRRPTREPATPKAPKNNVVTTTPVPRDVTTTPVPLRTDRPRRNGLNRIPSPPRAPPLAKNSPPDATNKKKGQNGTTTTKKPPTPKPGNAKKNNNQKNIKKQKSPKKKL